MLHNIQGKFWVAAADGSVTCLLCPHHCLVRKGMSGLCRTRTNREGVLYTVAYGNPCSVAVDPVEKKPVYHFLPGTDILSIATAGCNFHCLNCQNRTISQVSPSSAEHYEMSPGQVVGTALRYGIPSIAFTYTEPTVFYEYMYDIAVLAHANGLKTVMVSNGYIDPEPLADLLPYLDAANIDLKTFDESLYRRVAGGKLQPVLDTLLALRQAGVWTEITHLVIPDMTDDASYFVSMCRWLINNGFETAPLHISRFFPCFKLQDLPPTPVEHLTRARQTAMKIGLHFVYTGNVPGDPDGNTHCPACGRVVVERSHYAVTAKNLLNGTCASCGAEIPGVWGL